MVEVECGGFVFTSNFESGNMARVEQVPLPPKPPPIPGQSSSTSDVHDYEFNIWTNPDCAGTEFENSNRSWFYFGIRGGTPFTLVKLNLVNLNRQVKMYSQGMAPVFRILPGRGLWDRIREKPTYTIEDNVFTLSFRYRTLENVRATTYFAFTFPYSYQDLMTSLRGFDKRFKNCSPPEKYFPGQGLSCNADDIYYHREVVSYSLDGRRLDLLTISSHHGITPYREPRLKNLFPDLETPRPYIFGGKKVIFVSARVHPGEVPSSYVLNGLLESLLNRDDLTSILLRRMYVFKVVPMLNPDGVARGHFRTDTRGVNLNRVYLNPSLVYHPTIYAARAIIRYAHFGREIDDEVTAQVETRELTHVQCDMEAPEAMPMTDDHVENCQDIQPAPLSTCHSSASLENFIQIPTCSLQACEQFVAPDSAGISTEKDISMQCEAASHGDVDLLISDQVASQSDPIEMDIDKEKIIKEKHELPGNLKDSFCTGFPSPILNCDPINVPFDVTNAVQQGGETEVCSEGENKELILECSDVTALKRGVKQPMQCDENMGPEETKRRRDPKRKPASSDSSKPLRMFVKPVSRNEDAKNEDFSCHNGNVLSACLNPVKPSLEPSKSGLFLYMDMHGHASKKGIFMYGNHFDDIEQLVECMLLPKVMSINSQNFHFTACNFTERNMYLRDRRDGTSREGCGRVSVMKMTGLVRSYTLECNYNTGRMVNLLPPCVRDSGRLSVNPAYAVPPKYTPLVFEEVGRALGVSVLDLTSSNPCSRIPNSEYRSIHGIRDWLRSNCLSDSQLWTRMLHRPTRPQVVKKTTPSEVLDPDPSLHPVCNPSPMPDFSTLPPLFPLEASDSNCKEKSVLDNTSLDFAEYVLNTVKKIVSVTSAKSQDTLIFGEDEDRWYDRKKALQYEQELAMERIKVFEKYKFVLSSERERAYRAIFEINGLDCPDMKSPDAQKYSEFKATLEEELAAKREKVKKIREHDRLVREKFGKTCETKQLLRARQFGSIEVNDHKGQQFENSPVELVDDGKEFISPPNKIPVMTPDNVHLNDSLEACLETVNVLDDKIPQDSTKAGHFGFEKYCETPVKSFDGANQELSACSNVEGLVKSTSGRKSVDEYKSHTQKPKCASSDWKRKGERFRLKDLAKAKLVGEVNDSGMRRKDLSKKETAGSALHRKCVYRKKDIKVNEEKKQGTLVSEPNNTNLKSKAGVSKDEKGFLLCYNHNPAKGQLVKENVISFSLNTISQASKLADVSGNEILQYGNQTDSDIAEVMLREIRRSNCAESVICRDELFPVLQFNANKKSGNDHSQSSCSFENCDKNNL
ncbi:hypothetical protein ONE63_002379 [Megalurothrips usitatus]|uniref:Peptidase M14 domain-containing protein n=1 Tax=Megalurothrips usitatus TaxID=439358 RepID=A0AAV7XBS8_9NEOP|nr:hypothetical protein ONE63_002379 [Megalurothrips usitatus]